jgi:hypothetical protein
MVERTTASTNASSLNGGSHNHSSQKQLDAFGTPMQPKTPLNLQQRLEQINKNNSVAQKQLWMATFVSAFFIVA